MAKRSPLGNEDDSSVGQRRRPIEGRRICFGGLVPGNAAWPSAFKIQDFRSQRGSRQ